MAFYKELKKELEADRKNFVNQEKERYALTLVKRFGILPESTAKQILREPELQDFIKHLKLANGDGTIKNSYKEFYNNLIEIISEKISRHIANYIKEIYNPED